MTIAITQPTYLPWLGYFNLVATADIFVVLDTVQFEKQSWQSRNRLRTTTGDILWLSVPVTNQPLETPVKDIKIAPNPPGWRRKQMSTFRQNLRRAPFFAKSEALAETILGDQSSDTLLADLNLSYIQAVAQALHIETRFVRCSELPVTGSRAELLLNICNHFGADRYYSNAGSSVYLEASRPDFEKAGIDLVYQQWQHPEYAQTGSGFVSHLSSLDALACMGTAAAETAVKRGL